MSNQLTKKNPAEGYQKVFPKTFIDAIKDKESGLSLQEILQGFNMYFLSYNGSKALTRCKIPTILRKEGLWITYVLYDHTVVTEWYNSDQIDDKSWGSDSNWRVASNFLVGDVSVSADGYWVINGEKTEAKAQGEQGITPLLRLGANNKLQASYNTGKSWEDISNEFTSNLKISKYIGINESLPTSGVAEGTIYMKGPYYDENDSLNENPIYRMWVYAWKGNTLAWQDNGEFTSIIVGVVQEKGSSTDKVMSQKAVTDNLNTIIEAVTENNQALYPLEMTVTGLNNPYEEGVNATITLNISNKYKGSAIHPDDVYTEVNGVEISDGKFTEIINSSKVYDIESSYTYMYLDKNATINIAKTLNAVFVKPCWFGFSEYGSMEDIDMDETGGFTKYVKTSPNGTYTIKGNSEGYVWLCVPNTMSINKVTMSGFEFPIEELNIGGVTDYRNYRSSNKLLAGSYTIVIL